MPAWPRNCTRFAVASSMNLGTPHNFLVTVRVLRAVPTAADGAAAVGLLWVESQRDSIAGRELPCEGLLMKGCDGYRHSEVHSMVPRR